LKNRARPAYRAKALTAGMSDKAPRKKQQVSEMDESSMEGPTSPNIRPICCS